MVALSPQQSKKKEFSPFSRWRALWLRHSLGYSSKTSKKHQPFPIIQPFLRGYVIANGWCFFLWSSKGITRKTPQLWIQPRGKLEKKAVFSACCGDETTTHHDRAKSYSSLQKEHSLAGHDNAHTGEEHSFEQSHLLSGYKTKPTRASKVLIERDARKRRKTTPTLTKNLAVS